MTDQAAVNLVNKLNSLNIAPSRTAEILEYIKTNQPHCYNGEKETDFSPLQYKDQLRKDLIDYELISELLEKDEKDKALELIRKHIERIKSSLQD
ncbi:MAG: hypothetical protein NC078_04410 [Ruminococcus sp.]|nr:hypothetical protein [Ruminococcus sp.]